MGCVCVLLIRNMMCNINYLDLDFYKLQIFWQLEHKKKRISQKDIPFYRTVIPEQIICYVFSGVFSSVKKPSKKT